MTSRTSTRCCKRATLLVEDGQHVELGQQLHVGNLDPKEVLRVKGVRAVQLHLVDGVQGVYRSQGVPIHDKHIEVIVRQMLRKVTVVDHGDTDLLPGELVDRSQLQRAQPCRAHRGQEDRLGSSGGHGYHQGVARDRVVAVGRVVPGDHPRSDAGGHGGQVRPADGPQGERHHRKADPGRYRSRASYRNVSVEATEEAKAERYPNRIFTDDSAFSESDLSFVDFDSFSSDDYTPGTYN